MDVTDSADGSLDPRVQIELEKLNDATDDINKLETELDEAHTAFRQLLSETTKRLKEILNKVGNSCVDRARCYYEALEVARRAQVQCQQQAQLFQRASEIHAAAKETVALAESRFMSHQHEWNFDQAWQDMLNHATLKVMDAENQKAECGREHYRRALLFHDAEKKLLLLEERHHRSIMKARPYFEVKAQCDQMLATQKERVECLQKAIQEAKTNYATSLRRLEEISNQIHQQRRDSDFIANGPREPGVGAELVSPQKLVNYDMEFSQLNGNTMKDITNNQFNKCNRTEEYDENYQSQEDSEHLGKRSVDGSEATSSQWELELQAKLKNLNLSVGSSVLDSKDSNISNLHSYSEEATKSGNLTQESSCNFSRNTEFPMHNINQFKKLLKNFPTLKNPLANVSLMTRVEGPSAANNIADPIGVKKRTVDLKSSTSKSLSNSPTKTSVSSLGSKSAGKVDARSASEHVPNKVFKFGSNRNKSQSNNDINLTLNVDTKSMEKYQGLGDTLDNKTDNLEFNEPVADSKCDGELFKTREACNSGLLAKKNAHRTQLNTHSKVNSRLFRSNSSQFLSNNPSPSPVKLKCVVNSPRANSPNKKLASDPNKYSERLTEKVSSINELPLLSLFEKTYSLADSRGKSYSMITLDEKQNFVSSNGLRLNNAKSRSTDRLADSKDNLFLRVPR